MINALLKPVVGRRGTVVGAAAISAAAVITAVVLVILHLVNSSRFPNIGGLDNFAELQSITLLVAVLVGVVLGAVAGSFDAQEGTLRYLLLTGISRWRLHVARVGVLAIVCAVSLLPVAIVFVVFAFLPHETGQSVGAAGVVRGLGGIYIMMLAYGIVALGVGALLESNGAAIAVGLVLYLGVGTLLIAVRTWNETVGNLLLPNALQSVVQLEWPGDPNIVASAVVAAVWLALFVIAGGLRLQKGEY